MRRFVIVLADVAAVALLAACSREAPPPEPPPTIAEASPSALDRAREDAGLVDRTLAACPLLDPPTARLLLEDARRRGAPLESVAETGLYLADRAFEAGAPERKREAAGLVRRMVEGLGAHRGGLAAYLNDVRTGAFRSSAETERGRSMLRRGFATLRPAEQSRLRALFSEAIAQGVAAQGRTSAS